MDESLLGEILRSLVGSQFLISQGPLTCNHRHHLVDLVLGVIFLPHQCIWDGKSCVNEFGAQPEVRADSSILGRKAILSLSGPFDM